MSVIKFSRTCNFFFQSRTITQETSNCLRRKMYFYCLSHIQTSLTLTEDRPTEKQTGAGHYRCKLPPCIPLCYQSRESWGALSGKQGWATRGLPLSNPSKHQREAPVMWDSWKLLKIIQVFRNGAQVPLYRDLPTTPLISTTALKRAFHSITFRQTRGTRTRQVHLNEAQCSLLTKNNKKKPPTKQLTHTHTLGVAINNSLSQREKTSRMGPQSSVQVCLYSSFSLMAWTMEEKVLLLNLKACPAVKS